MPLLSLSRSMIYMISLIHDILYILYIYILVSCEKKKVPLIKKHLIAYEEWQPGHWGARRGSGTRDEES